MHDPQVARVSYKQASWELKEMNGFTMDIKGNGSDESHWAEQSRVAAGDKTCSERLLCL
jgi:hypothetical protein